ncbi:MAG TPA: hypothetical protein PLY37_02810, partial [Candidatus Pacearchaeota archaeon]|nr:hypothetical protein [Candidatus Pacearchaeota archaeon]
TIADINPDLAEKFPTKDETIEFGDVVAVDVFNKEHIVKTDKEYQTNAMGVVSTKPGIILGGLTENNGANVALAGRIPVKVNLNNGEIKAGDYLTSSDIPGIAMKATKAGKVLGIALEDFSQNDFDSGKNKIIMFVDPQFIGNDLIIAQNQTGEVITQYQLTLQDIQNKLSEIGIVLNQDGYFEAKTVKAKKLITEQIELIDKTTQELHCIWYENGVRHEEIGACSDVLQESTGSNIPSQASDPADASSTASQTTSTQESNSTTSSVVSQLPLEPDASSSNPTSESLPPEPESQPVKNPESIVSEPVALPEEPVLESQALPSQ